MKDSTSFSRDPNKCYFLVSIAGEKAQKVVFELATKNCPKTCENFASFCETKSKDSKSYKGTQFHRIIPNFMVQGGDYEKGNGSGGESFSGGRLIDESFELKHDAPGVLSMANRGKDTAGSQFFITLAKTPHLDGKHVVFGRVIDGMEVVHAMAEVETDEKDRPISMQKIVIVDCGLGDGSLSEDDGSVGHDDRSSEYKRERKSKKKSSKKKKSSRREKYEHSDDFSSSTSSSMWKRGRKHRKKSSRKRDDGSNADESDYSYDSRHERGRKRIKEKRRRRDRDDYSSDNSTSERRDRERGRERSRDRRRKKSSRKDSHQRKKRRRDYSDDDHSYSSEDSRRRSKKKKSKSHKRSHKESKRRSKSDLDDQKAASKSANTGNSFGQYGIIRESDLMTSTKVKRNFEIWLEEVKGIPQSTNMAKWEMSNYFKDYAEDFNTATLPHQKYYDYDKWEIDEYQKKKDESRSKKGAIGDEFEFQEEMKKRAAEKKAKEFQMVKTMMSKEKIEEMKKQARLKSEMVNAYRVGDEETRLKLQRRLEPDAK